MEINFPADLPGNKKHYSLAFSAIILIILAYLVDFSETVSVLSDTDLALLIAGFAMGNASIVFQSIAWFSAFRSLDFKISLVETLKMKISCLFIDNITPFGDFGGEPAVAYLIKDSLNEDYSRTLSAIAFSDFISFTPFLLVSALGGVYLLTINFSKELLIKSTGLLSGIIVLIVFLILWKIEKVDSLAKNIFLHIENILGVEKILRDNLDIFLTGLNSLKSDFSALFSILVLSWLAFLSDILCFLILAASIGVEVNIILLGILISLSRIANFTPTLGGSGFYEATLTGLLATFSAATASEALSLAIIYRFTTSYFGTVIGLFSLNLRLIPKELNYQNEKAKL